MKKYKVEYFKINKLNCFYLTELSKSEKRDGVRISFFSYGRRTSQTKYKNDLLSGILKIWWSNSKNWYFQNCKKRMQQGIKIIFRS